MKLMLALLSSFLIISCDNKIVRPVSDIKYINQTKDSNESSIDTDQVKWYGNYQYDNLELNEELGISYGITIDINIDKNNCFFEVAGTQVYENFKCKVEVKDKIARLININDNDELASLKYLNNAYMIQTKYIENHTYHFIDIKPN